MLDGNSLHSAVAAMLKLRRFPRGAAGFTLVELLLVVAFIALLAALAVPLAR